MARRLNELFIGEEFLNEEGRDIKHIGLISEYGNQQYKKTSETPLLLEGMDLETDSKTGELKLLGVYNGDYYRNYTTGFLGEFFEIVKSLYWRGKKTGTKGAIAYWNKLDPFVLYKQFLLLFEEDKQKISMRRYGKISGEWNTKQGKWKIKPITEVEVKRGTRRFRFGIKNVIRSSVLFYFYEMEGNLPKQLDNGQYPLSTVWAYDVAQLYKGHLAKEMESRADIFPYYSKIDESAHLVDWDRYFTERHYRVEIVDKSNYFDAKAVFDLGNLVSTNFYSAFQCYPKNLISAGAIARASVIATFYNKYEGYGYPESEIWKSLEADAKSIALINYKDVWAEQIGEDSTKDMFCAFYEAYSGGYIEAILYGLIEAGYSSDIASAYIKYITMLKDLRDSIITTGEGVPPHIDNSYCVIRGRVKIPLEVNFMPITVKHVTQKATNVRAVGEYIATYHIEERDYMIKQGAEFFDETWWNIETTGKISPYGEVATLLTDKRYELLEQGDSAEYLVKTATASLYGILFEATHTYKENIHMDVFKAGYRAGEYLNSLFASWITSQTRIQMADACNKIEANGGKVALVMTDCAFVEGDVSTMPEELISREKTLGRFETPQPFSKMASLGTGRYSYVDPVKGKVTTKNRGLNVVDFHNEDGIDVGTHDWLKALKIAEAQDSFTIRVKTRTLISVGMIAYNNVMSTIHEACDGKGCSKCEDGIIDMPIGVKDLGRIVETYRDVDLITGLTKRILDEPLKEIKDISRGNVETRSIYYSYGMQGDNAYVDQTLPILRQKVSERKMKTVKKMDQENRSKASYKYASNEKNKVRILQTEREKYAHIRSKGFNRDIAKKWCKRSMERISQELINA